MAIEGQRAYLLHSRKYTDSRVILELLTQEYGRVSAVFRYRHSAKKSTPVQAFVPLYVDWKGRAGLKTILNLEPNGVPLRLESTNLYCGMYLNEILQRVLPQEDPCDAIFEQYQRAIAELSEINDEPYKREQCLRVFELDLLEQLGFAINFSEDIHQNPISTGQKYRYINAEGFVLDTSGGPDGFPAEVVFAIRDRKFSSPVSLKYAKLLCRRALQPLIGNKPLNSREFFR